MMASHAPAFYEVTTRHGQSLACVSLRARTWELLGDKARLLGRTAPSRDLDLRRDSAWLLPAKRERCHWNGYSAVLHGPRRGYWLPWPHPRRNFLFEPLQAAQWIPTHVPKVFMAAFCTSHLVVLPRQRPKDRFRFEVVGLSRR